MSHIPPSMSARHSQDSSPRSSAQSAETANSGVTPQPGRIPAHGNRSSATYNLELLLAGVTGITLRQRHVREPVDDAASLVGELSDFSREAYRGLLKMEGFIDFFRSATPIDALEVSSIGGQAGAQVDNH
jgi:phosphoenolpyruvate carboxylase